MTLLEQASRAHLARDQRPIEVVAVAVREPDKPRRVPAGVEVTGDAKALCAAPGHDAVVELIGGVDIPRELIATALRAGKDVVTANKAVLAHHGDELFALAHDVGKRLLFEASVAGAVPILQALQAGLPAAPIEGLTGILNGTCNRILADLEHGKSYADALADAQAQGFAEADPSLDLSGADAAHKIALLATIVTGRRVPLDAIRCDGIEAVTPADLEYGGRFGWRLKLLARYRRVDDESAAIGVHPAWVDAQSPLGTVGDEDNGILLEGPPFGTLVFQGKGAGGPPTAGSVVADILRAARGEGQLPASRGDLRVVDPFTTPGRYSLRFMVPDRPGILAGIASALGDNDISIAAVEQPPTRSNGPVPIYMITHEVETAALDRALETLAGEDYISESPLRVRIEVEAS